MGRHRRSAAGRAATGRATGVTETDGSYTSGYDPQHSYDYDPQHSYGLDQQFSYDFDADARGHHSGEYPTVGIAPYLNPEAHTRSDAYLYATDDEYAQATGTTSTALFPSEGFSPGDGPRRGGGSRRRRKKRVVTPVKTGLLGVSAAVAIGTVAVATGVVPGLDNYKLGGGNADNVQAADTPTNSATEQGGTSGSADEGRDDEAASRDGERAASPTPSASASTAAPTKAPSKKPTATPSEKKPETTPSRTATKAPANTKAPVTVSAEAQAEAEVLKLVNDERAKVGCSPVAANSALGKLAEDFSDAMAAEGFFDHTDPSGNTPGTGPRRPASPASAART